MWPCIIMLKKYTNNLILFLQIQHFIETVNDHCMLSHSHFIYIDAVDSGTYFGH
jgi:hypothetical protein